MTHFLKTHPQFFAAVDDGSKPFEARKDDRQPPFAVGDELCLQEFVPGDGGGFTGREIDRKVSYVLRGTEHVAPGYCVLGLEALAIHRSKNSAV